MSTSPFAPITLNGVSQYSSDLQNVLTRAVQIAAIPVQALQNRDSKILAQQTALSTLSSTAADLATSLQALGTVASSQGLSATSSAPAVVSVSNASATTPANYTIDSITSAASAAGERSLNHYADSAATPVSATGTMQLTVGSTPYQFTLTNNNLVTLRDTINGLGAGVTASILTTSGGNYLSISANSTGATTLQLVDDPGAGHANTPELTNTNQGTNAVFQLNGIPVSQPGNVVNNVIPGVAFTILNSSTAPVTLSLQSDPTQLSSGLQNFVTSYNAMRTQLNGQEGPAAGALSGDTAVSQIEDVMRHIASYTTTSGSVTSLASLGVEFDSSGQASFNQTTFSNLTATQVSDGFKFIGSATAGLGGISKQLTQLSDPVTGLINIEQAGLTTTDKNIQTEMTTLTDRITTMQSNMAAQLQKADSLLAMLASQQQSLTASLQGLNVVLYGKAPGSA
jgi:flagellar hook-associated protein 2